MSDQAAKTRFVVLLRGVNVGKGNRVPMAGFRSMLEAMGHTGVKTLLNSGNAVFASPQRSEARHAAAIAAALREQLGVDTPVVVKSAGQLAAIVEGAPGPPPEEDHSRYLVVFASDPAGLQSLAPVLAMAKAPDRFEIGAHAAYLHCPGGLLDSPTAKALLGRPGRAVTTRNWATVLKLHALLGAD